jgi:hypothetical protein
VLETYFEPRSLCEAFAKDGLWLSTRLIASNIAQYIVSLYTLLLGLELTRTVSKNYDSVSSKQYLRKTLNSTLDRAVDEGLVTRLSSNVSSLVGDFLSTTTMSEDKNCSSTPESIFEMFCQSVPATDTFQCDESADVNYICPLIGARDLNGFQKMALLDAAGFDADSLAATAQSYIQQAVDATVDSLYPSEKYMVVVPLAIGTVVAFSTAAYLALTYIPSVATTILKLRSGAIPTLRDSHFNKYRVAADQVAILTGSLFWGCFISSIVVGGIVGLLVFVFLWQATIYFVQRFVAIVIGLLVVTLIRQIAVRCCRRAYYRGFYRKKPAAANLSLLALEWANFALSAGFIFMRMVKLLLVAGAFIGRIDSPFLAPGVGEIGPLELDNYPTVHLKDVLSQEAHRHPYIEQLGTIYLMKLRYREHFGKTAGSCWRLLFVYALMPWLHKYRVLARPELARNAPETDLEAGRRTSRLSFISLRHMFDDDEGEEEEEEDSESQVDGAAVEVIAIVDATMTLPLETLKGIQVQGNAVTHQIDSSLGGFVSALDAVSLRNGKCRSSPKQDRIQKLEEENERLRMKLAVLEALREIS